MDIDTILFRIDCGHDPERGRAFFGLNVGGGPALPAGRRTIRTIRKEPWTSR
jgi:hypothetical protein